VPELRDVKSERARLGLGLMALLMVAAGVRWIAWSRTVVLFNDGPVFLGMAQAIEAGRWAEVLAHPFHPLYPALVALVAQGPIDYESAAVAVSIFGGLLSVLGIFLFVRQAFDRELAWLAAWTVALHPWAVDFSSDVMSDGLYAGLFLLGFAAMSSLVERTRMGAAIACGVATGLAYLVRPEGVGLLIACGMLLLIKARARSGERRRIVLAMAGMTLAAILVMGPFLGSLLQQTGELRLTQKKSITALAAGAAPVERETASESSSIAKAEAAGATVIPMPRSSERIDGGGATRPARNVFGFLEALSRAARTSLAALRYEIAFFALIGCWALRSEWRFSREATVALPALLYSGVLVLLVWGAGYVARRHALAALLPICAYAALGWRTLYRAAVDHFFAQDVRRAAQLRRPTSVCLVLILVLCAVWGARDLRVRRPEREPLRLAAEWLGEHASMDAPVAAQKLRVAYYSGAVYVPLPSGNDGHIEDILRAEGVGWVVIEESDLDDHRGLAAGLGRWLVPIHSVERAGHRALVLEMRPKPAI
jgi:hypothetical protein